MSWRSGTRDARSSRRPALGLRCAALAVVCCLHASASAQNPLSPPRVLPEHTRQKIDSLIDHIHQAEAEIRIPLRRSKLLRMKKDIIRAAVADPGLIEFVAFGTREIELIGRETGATNVTLWLGDPESPEVLTFVVHVEYDRAVDDQRRAEYTELENAINELFINSKIRLFPVADKLIVKGQARDSEEAAQIMAVLRGGGGFGGTADPLAGLGVGGLGAVSVGGIAATPFPGASNIPPASIINMLTVPGEQQVLLKVRIAELSRSALRSMSVNFNINTEELLFRSTLGGLGNIRFRGTFDDISFNAFITALESHGVAKILAQPNLVTLSGQPATFVSGGQFAVPTVVGVGGAQAATTYFHNFGTQLAFTPTVIDKDRIRLQVTPTFSSINDANTVNGIPGLNTRSASTTVDLREGQVLAIAGLIESSQSGGRTRVPILGTLPLVGWAFNSKEVNSSETELIILVTPELVHAMEPECAPSLLPGMELTEPSDHDFYCRNRIEGRPNLFHRSTVWPNYRDQLLNPKLYLNECQQSEGYFLHGPHGFSN